MADNLVHFSLGTRRANLARIVSADPLTPRRAAVGAASGLVL